MRSGAKALGAGGEG